MNVAEFVEETLSEILSGIRAAQNKEGGGAIGSAGLSWLPNHRPNTLLLPGGLDAVFTSVEFDVSVVAETSGGGKGGLKVWSVGVEAGGQHSNQQTSRVRFAVQLKIPSGDAATRPKGF
jgi:hypothetical protein